MTRAEHIRLYLFVILLIMNMSPLSSQTPDTLIYDSIAIIEFEPCAKQNYGFDAYTKGKQHIFYQHLPTQTGKTYHVPWKSIGAGKTDYVDVKLKYLFNGFSRKNLHFETSTGQPVKYKLINSKAIYRLQIKGEPARSKQGKTYSILAYYKKDGQNYLVGKLNIKPYDQIKKNIAIVPVNGADVDIKGLEKHINDIFKQAVAKIKITEIPLSIPWDSLDINALTEFEAHQQRLELFKRHLNKNITDSIQADYVLFLFEPDPLKPNERTTLNAVNYENQPYGIFYLKNNTKEKVLRQITQTVAHGCSKLKHSWEMGAGSQNGTDNLMDYKGSTDLFVYQWHNIHDPAGGLGWFQDVEDGKSTTIYIVTTLDYQTVPVPDEYKTGEYLTFISPAGLPISVPKSATGFGFQSDKFFNLNVQEADKQGGITVAPEALTNFIYDGKKYGAVIVGGNFIGYYPNSSRSGVPYPDGHSIGKTTFEILAHDNGSIKKADCDFDKVKANEKGKYLSNGPYIETLGLPCIGGSGYLSAVKIIADKLKALISSNDTYVDAGIGISGQQKKVLNDKFKVCHDAAQKQIYLVQAPINFELKETDKENFIDDVISQCDSFDPLKMMFICMPYYFDNTMAKNNVKPLANLTTLRGFFRTNDFNLALNTIDFNSIVLGIYENVPKPYYLYSYFINYKGELTEFGTQKSSIDITGHDCIYEYVLGTDSRMSKYIDLIHEFESLNRSNTTTNPFTGQVTVTDPLTPAEVERAGQLHDEIINFTAKNPDNDYKTVRHGIFESCLAEKASNTDFSLIARQFSMWYRHDKFQNMDRIRYERVDSPDDNCFIIGTNQIVYEQILASFDAMGVLLIPVGLDFIGDGLGAIYTAYYQDWDNAAIYSAALAIPVGSAIILRQTKALAKGTSKITLQANELIIVEKTAIGATVSSSDELLDLWRSLFTVIHSLKTIFFFKNNLCINLQF